MTDVEVWAPVLGFDNLYQVSNLGRVKSNDRITNNGNGEYLKRGRIMKPQPNSNGYLRVDLKSRSENKRSFVHRMVAASFVANPLDKPDVNHIDSNFLNNSSSNLEWVTHRENIHHAIRKGRFEESFSKTNEKFKKDRDNKTRPVTGTSRTGRKIEFSSVQEAGRYFINGAPGICRCCKGVSKTSQGYEWEYTDTGRN